MKKYTILSLTSLLLSLWSCTSKNSEHPALDSTDNCISESIAHTLKLEKVTRKPIEQSITLNGYVDYNLEKTVEYTSLVDGVVLNTHFNLGDYVQKGQLLAEIKSVDLNNYLNEVNELTAELNTAKRELTFANSMYEDGISSQRELTEAKENVAAITSRLTTAKSSLAIFNRKGESNVFKVVAPLSGFVVHKGISNGMTINSGSDPLFKISDLSDISVVANVYTQNMRHIKTNQKVNIATQAYPEELFSGDIIQISQNLDKEEGSLKARISIQNSELKLKPGMAVDIIANLKVSDETLVAIPNKAIIFDNNQYYVVVYKDNCEQEIRQITVSSRNLNYTYISAGVSEDEEVIVTNELLVYEKLMNQI